jgi:hypothetical protein
MSVVCVCGCGRCVVGLGVGGFLGCFLGVVFGRLVGLRGYVLALVLALKSHTISWLSYKGCV